MSTYDLAAKAARDFNTIHGGSFLKAVPQKTEAEPLRSTEVVEFVCTRQGQFLASQVFAEIRNRTATHSEAIAAGRLLKAMGFRTKKLGPQTAYLLDNSHLADVG